MTLALRYAVRSDVGLLREGNEDSAYAGPRLLAVADGMGGHAAGEVASAVTIGAMSELDRSGGAGEAEADMMADLSGAVAAANMRLQQMIMANPAIEGMGTTLTAVLWADGHAAVCHIGDSRGYLLRQGELYQITHDHTLVQSLVDEGRITEDDVSTHPQRSLLLRALDGRTIAEPDLSVHEAQLGDRYLLCSDGLSGVVSDETLRDTLAGLPDPEACTRQLIDLAIRGGGPDNITCIVADVVDVGVTRPTTVPVMAGAAANGTDPRSQAPGTNPFAAVSGTGPQQTGSGPQAAAAGGVTGLHPMPGHGTGPNRQQTRTAPQPVLTDDEPFQGVNGSAGPETAESGGRRGHRAVKAKPARRKRWPIVTSALVVLVVALGVGGYLAYSYTQDQYYVAVNSSGHVVIYQGVNQSVAGVSLSHPHTDTGIALSQVSSQYRQELAGNPSASSLAGAQRIVRNISSQVQQCNLYYHQLQTWQTDNTNYLNQLHAAEHAHRSTKNIKPPGPQPTAPLNIDCPPSTAYGVPASSIPAVP
jgi:PPM family protein phosphatase